MKQLIEEVDGVQSASVDLASGRATVTVKPGVKLNEQALRDNVDRDFKVESLTRVTH